MLKFTATILKLIFLNSKKMKQYGFVFFLFWLKLYFCKLIRLVWVEN
jgi:hypothetical protein